MDSRDGSACRTRRTHKGTECMGLNILVVDDDEVTRKLLKEVLERDGYQVSLAPSGEEAVKALKKQTFPIVLSDIRMLELDGMAVLRAVKKAEPDTAVILMTGFGSMEGAIEAIQEGAFDYVSKPFKMDDLKSVMARAAKHWESLRSAKAAGQEQVRRPAKMDVGARGIIGKSPKIVEVYKTLARAAMSTSTVLVNGESGTGKELVARAIHDNGARRITAFHRRQLRRDRRESARERAFRPRQRIFHRRDGRQARAFRGSQRRNAFSR